MNTPTRMGIGAPHLNAGNAHGQLGAAMETVSQADKLVIAGINGGQQHGSLIGLGSGGAEEGLL